MNTTEIKIEKTHGIYYTIARVGQESISIGDGIIVRATVCLPVGSNSWLTANLRYGRRVIVCNEMLHTCWGILDDGFRAIRSNFSAATWEHAFAIAEKYCESELDKLFEAMAKRAQSLADAE